MWRRKTPIMIKMVKAIETLTLGINKEDLMNRDLIRQTQIMIIKTEDLNMQKKVLLTTKKEKKEAEVIMVINTMVDMIIDIETRKTFLKEINQK